MADEFGARLPVRLSRETLYEQVWQTPMNRLAARYGITGNGLAKICARHKIPYPPRGYWAKKSAGKPVIASPLPENSNQRLNTILIKPKPFPAGSPLLPLKEQEKVDAARAHAMTTIVPQRLSRPHPIIAAWLAEHQERRRFALQPRNPMMSVFDPGEFSKNDRRRHRFLNTLFKTLERQGAKITDEKHKGLFVELQGERIEIQVREKFKQVRHKLAPNEMRLLSPGEKRWRSERQTTSMLLFAIKSFLPRGLKTEWLESDEKPLEEMLPDIIAAIMAAVPLLVARTRAREESDRCYELAQQQRYEAEQRRKLDEGRWKRLVDLSQQWREAALVRRFVARLKREEMEIDRDINGMPLGVWLEWAEKKIAATDPSTWRPEEVFASVASVTTSTYRD